MKFIVEQDKLSSNLSWVSRAIPSRPNHPILSNIFNTIELSSKYYNNIFVMRFYFLNKTKRNS